MVCEVALKGGNPLELRQCYHQTRHQVNPLVVATGRFMDGPLGNRHISLERLVHRGSAHKRLQFLNGPSVQELERVEQLVFSMGEHRALRRASFLAGVSAPFPKR